MQHGLCLFARAGAGQLADIAEHPIQLFAADAALLGGELHLLVGGLALLCGQRVHIAVEGLFQFGHQPRDFIVARALLERVR